VTHTGVVQWFSVKSRCLWGALILAPLLSCQNSSDDAQGKKESSPLSEVEEQSPNARILPEPLQQGARLHPSSELGEIATGASRTDKTPRLPRNKPRPWPILWAPQDDQLKARSGSGIEMILRFSWPQASRTTMVGELEHTLWPHLRVQLLRELPGQPARMKVILEQGTFLFPLETALVARADRHGYALLWPDARSYRIVPEGSLRSLFADRRVDVLPWVEPEMKSLGKGRRLGRATTSVEIGTAGGKARMETTIVKDLPFAAPLLCAALLELIRVQDTQELCPTGQLPLHMGVTWLSEESLSVEVVSIEANANFETDQFRIPPALPIFKRGELPPFDESLFSKKVQAELFPWSEDKEPPLAAPPVDLLEKGDTPPAKPPVEIPKKDTRPRNQIEIENAEDRPLLIMVNRLPLMWLGPGESRFIYVKSGDVRYSARDFLGESVFLERSQLPPGKVRFGGEEEGANASN